MAPRKPTKKKAPPAHKPFMATVAFRQWCKAACGWEECLLPDDTAGLKGTCTRCGEPAEHEPLTAAYRCPECGSTNGIVSIAGPSVSNAPLCRVCMTEHGYAVPMTPSDDEGESP